MVVAPVDLVREGDDGVLCVPFDDMGTALKGASGKYDAEQRQVADIQAGTHNPF